MKELTQTRPKPLIQVGGKPLIDHALALLDGTGIDRVVVNTHYLSHQIADHLADRNIRISHEADLLETGGGLKHAIPLLDADYVITLNADAVWSGQNPIARLLDAWQPEKMDALLMLTPKSNAVGHVGAGDFLLASDGQIQRGPDHIFTGCQIIKTSQVARVTERVFSLNLVWDEILKNNKAYGLVHDGKWSDVGHPEGIPLAENLLDKTDV